MPYPTVESLPAAVKKFPTTKQRQFMHVWNGEYKSHGDEKRAFATAWSVIQKADDTITDKLSRFLHKTADLLVAGVDEIAEEGWEQKLDSILAKFQPDMADMHVDTLDKAKTCPSCNKPMAECTCDKEDVEKAAAAINDLPDSDFAYIEPGGSKDKEGKTTPRSKRHFPIHDPSHVRNALARVNQSSFGSKALGKIISRARGFGIKIEQGMAAKHLSKENIPYIVGLEKDDFDYVLTAAELPASDATSVTEMYAKLHKTEVSPLLFDVQLCKSSLVDGIVYGIVYEPNKKDTQGDWTSNMEIEHAAHAFLPLALHKGTSSWADINHSKPLEESAVEIVESYIAPADFVLPSNEQVSKGSWVIAARINSIELRKAIENEELTGFSLEGQARRLDIDL